MGIARMFMRHIRKVTEMRNLLLLNFVVLLVNLFFLVMQFNKGFWPIETFFQPIMTDEDKHVMQQTMRALVGAMEAANLTYFLYAGTLIGSYRHHGPIPWDDDIDLMLNASQKSQVRKALTALRPEYDLYPSTDDPSGTTQWKFYSNYALTEFVHKPFKWPYIDIFFFKENGTHIWDEVPRFSDHYKYPKSEVFPLLRRPFLDMNLPTPCDTHAVLARNYNITLCRSRSFSHAMELPMFTFETKDIPCTQLHYMFPFVHRTYTDGIVNETLRIGDWKLQSAILPSHCKGRHP